MPLSADDRAAIDAFRRDVLEASLTTPVLVRFTADWCGPCKQLAPIIDKAIAATGGKARQVVVDIDRQRLIAEQFRIQSVPTVYAFIGGRPVDGFVGARSEREVKAFLDKLLANLPPTDAEADIEAMIEAASQALADGEAQAAAEAFAALARELPDRADIVAGYARALIALGQLDGADKALAALPADSSDSAVTQARAALELAKKAAPPSEIAALEARVAAHPADHQARIDLARALFALGRRDAAADQLFAAIAADRDWNEGAARAELLKLIEVAGFGDPWSVATRRRLSKLLFA